MYTWESTKTRRRKANLKQLWRIGISPGVLLWDPNEEIICWCNLWLKWWLFAIAWEGLRKNEESCTILAPQNPNPKPIDVWWLWSDKCCKTREPPHNMVPSRDYKSDKLALTDTETLRRSQLTFKTQWSNFMSKSIILWLGQSLWSISDSATNKKKKHFFHHWQEHYLKHE